MARRTTRRPPPASVEGRSGPAHPSDVPSPEAPARSIAVPSAAPGDVPETTGRYLVLMEPGGIKAGVDALMQRTSVRLAYAGDFLSEPAGVMSINDSEGVVFEDLGVAIVNAPPDQAAAVSSAVAQDSALRVVEPERVVHAFGGPIDLSYLRGYRDAVNHLVDGVLAGETARGASVAASFDETALTWGLQAIGVDRSRFGGRGIRIAVLDTGLDLGHPDLAGRAIVARSFVDGVASAQDGHGHGTHCVGIAMGSARPGQPPRFGVAPDAKIFVGKVLNDAGRGVDGSILAGLQWAIANKCEVISMSLGAPVLAGQAHSRVFEQAAQRALGLGTLIVAAAGNDSRRPQVVAPVSHPANCPSIVAVGAVDRNLNVARFSNGSVNTPGGSIDVVGPGVDCRSSWPMPDRYKNESGTSMATPHVAGVAALHAEADPEARGALLQLRLTQTARRLDGPVSDVGAGLAQAPR